MLVPTGAEGKYEYDPSIPAGSGGGGGGGSSDFSIAHVTITNNASNSFVLFIPWLAPVDDDYYLSSQVSSGDIDSSGYTMDIVLYKGTAYLMLDSEQGFEFAFTGDITGDTNLTIITGDGTITITDSK